MSRLTSAKPTEVEKEVSHTGSENPVDGRGLARDAIGSSIAPPEKSCLFLCNLPAAHHFPQTSFLWEQAPSGTSKL